MHEINPSVKFFLNLGKTQTILTHRFDRGLNGLGFSEFLILFHLDQAENKKMRRVDLAEKIGMTASGITRMLLPMEKIGLVKSGPAETDARVRFVMIANGGKKKLDEAVERIEILAEEIIPANKIKEIENFSDLLLEIGGRALMS
ncbi:MAG: MarR family winged helix-turn-helix transcriptional regulator [bacterium]